MQEQQFIDQAFQEIQRFFQQPNAFRSVLLLIVSIVVVYWLSKFIARGIIKLAQVVAAHSDSESDDERLVRLRQIETYLSVTIAMVRAALVLTLGYVAWRILSPDSNISIAAIGAGTIFVIFAGQTLGILLRDITAGATMIIEKWFNVGDYIKVEPFMDVAGVVERFTLRSTRLRSLSGEIIWIHNQQMMAVHVTPRGVRTMAVDIFVRDRVAGERAIEKIIGTVPTGATLLARPLRIKYAERWDDELWRITVVGETPPGREWLIEKYFVNALKEIDEDKKKADRLFIHEPMARYADPEADRRFSRAVRLKKEK
ncbi:MAG TPA: mechanosensitive ion channel family protein [Candidatus Saccharimonadales bacterium]|nr:mechanosensitive ion channel family protein [Candidatus Saccharimonadales bacterium]